MGPKTHLSTSCSITPLSIFVILQLLQIISTSVNYFLPSLLPSPPCTLTIQLTVVQFRHYASWFPISLLVSGRGLNDFAFLHFQLYAIIFSTFLFPSIPFGCLSLLHASTTLLEFRQLSPFVSTFYAPMWTQHQSNLSYRCIYFVIARNVHRTIAPYHFQQPFSTYH